MPALRYYLDFISPYAYLGWSQVQALAQRRELTLRPVPVLFAAMLDAFGHKGPAEIPPKREYTFKHVLRLAHDLELPLVPPPAHPFNPLLGLRIASLPMDAAARVRVIDLLFERTWGTGLGVTDPVAVAQALSAAGLPGEALVAQASTPEAKARVRQQTADALERGVFGVPSVELEGTGEVFWGQDSLPHFERFADGHDPVRAELLERWRDLPAGSNRAAVKG